VYCGKFIHHKDRFLLECATVPRVHKGQGGTGPLRLTAGRLNQMRQNIFVLWERRNWSRI